MDVRGKAGKGTLVLFGSLNKRRSLRADRHRINQHQRSIIESVEQMAAQGRGAAEIMRDNIGLMQTPMIVERREQLILNTTGYVAVRLV